MNRLNPERASGAVRQMVFDPTGQKLYVSSEPGELAVYDLATHQKTISDARVTANGSLLIRGQHSTLLAISDRRKLIELDLYDGRLVHEFPETIDTSLRYAVTRDGQSLAGVDSKRHLFLADLSNGNIRELNVTVPKNPAMIWFTEKDSVINSVDETHGWRRWNTATLQPLTVPAWTTNSSLRINSADFSEQMNGGPLLAVGTTSGNLLLMSPPGASQDSRPRLVHGNDRLVVSCLPPTSIITADETVQIHQLDPDQPPQIIETTSNANHAVTVSQDARFVAVGSDDGSVSVLDTRRPEILTGSFRIFDGQADRGFGFPRTLLTLANNGLTCVGHSGGWIATINGRTGVPTEAFSVCEGGINSMVAHPVKPIVAVGNGGDDQSVIVLKYDPDYRFGKDPENLFQSTPVPIARIPTDGDVRVVAFANEGKSLLASLRNGHVIFIDCESWQITASWKCHEGGIYAMDVKGDLIVTGGQDGFVRVGRASDGAEQLRWKAHGHRITCLRVSHDGRRIYTGTHEGELAAWDIHGQRITTLVGHVGPVLCLEFSASGETLFSGGHDRRILLWDSLTGDLQREITAHSDRVMDLEFLSSEASLLSSSLDGSVNRWGYEPRKSAP
ncbi:MAG: WD40 repeat domain-containing protein [Planctomycetaceae bacterium]